MICKHPDAVRWNPHNGVVQCHVCGQVWVPLDPAEASHKLSVLNEQRRLSDAKPTDPCTNCSDDCYHCSRRSFSFQDKTPEELMALATTPPPPAIDESKLQLPPSEFFYARAMKRSAEIKAEVANEHRRPQVGEEWMYLDQFVKVLEIHGTGEYREVLIETRFGERTTVPVSELYPKPPRRGR